MQRSSRDVPEQTSGSSSSSDKSERLGVLPRAVSADDGALRKAALQVQKDLAGVEIPEVTSVAALSAAATSSIGNTPLAAGQDTPATAESAVSDAPNRLSPALLRALDAETDTQSGRQSGFPASLAVQPAGSRRGSNDSIAEPLPSSAYAESKSRGPDGRKGSGLESKPTATAGKSQPSRFAVSPRGAPGPAAPESESSDSEGYPEPTPGGAGAGATPGQGTAAPSRGLAVAVPAANRAGSEADGAQDMESPSSARPLLAGPFSTAVVGAPGPVHVSPKGSVIGFMPVPHGQHPLHGEDDSMVRRPLTLLLAHVTPHSCLLGIMTVAHAVLHNRRKHSCCVTPHYMAVSVQCLSTQAHVNPCVAVLAAMA